MVSVAPPTRVETVTALRLVARVLGAPSAYRSGSTTYFELGDGWLLGLRPDSAGRLRVVACYGTTEVATLWCLARDHGRLAALARGLRDEAAALEVA